MNCIVCAAMLARSRPRVCQCPLTRITPCVGLLVYIQSYFFSGGLCDQPLWVFVYSKSLFVPSACSSRAARILEPSAMIVNNTAEWNTVDCIFIRVTGCLLSLSSLPVCVCVFHACVGKCSDARGIFHKYLFSTLGYQLPSLLCSLAITSRSLSE